MKILFLFTFLVFSNSLVCQSSNEFVNIANEWVVIGYPFDNTNLVLLTPVIWIQLSLDIY